MGGGSVSGRGIGGIALAGMASLAVASTVFGRRDGVDPRLLLLAMVAAFAVVPARRLIASLPVDGHRSPPLHPPVDRSPGPAPPPGLTRWIGQVNGGASSARAATLRLVPALRELTRLRLADRRGVSLDHSPSLATDILGSQTMAVIGPDAPRPMDADRPGLPLDAIEHVTATLESL